MPVKINSMRAVFWVLNYCDWWKMVGTNAPSLNGNILSFNRKNHIIITYDGRSSLYLTHLMCVCVSKMHGNLSREQAKKKAKRKNDMWESIKIWACWGHTVEFAYNFLFANIFVAHMIWYLVMFIKFYMHKRSARIHSYLLFFAG